MSDFIIKKIVDIFLEEPTILRDPEKCFDGLGLSASDMSELRQLRNKSEPQRTIFKRALESYQNKFATQATYSKLAEDMKKAEFVSAAERILTLESSTLNPVITKPLPYFVGRTDKLNEIDEIRRAGRFPQLCITGSEGIGKSECARKYVTQYLPGNFYWLTAQDMATLHSSIIEAAASSHNSQASHNSLKSITPVNLIKQFFRKCETRNHYSCVLDGVNHLYEGLSQVLDVLKEYGYFVIITTRMRGLLGNSLDYDHVELKELEMSHAIEMVQLFLPEISEQDAEILCIRLQRHPFGMYCSLSIIRDRRLGLATTSYSVHDFITELDKMDVDVFDKGFGNLFKLALNNLDGTQLHNLRIMALLQSENIKLHFLQKLCSKYTSEENFRALETLKRRECLIDSDNNVLRIHVLLQMHVKRDMLPGEIRGVLESIFYWLIQAKENEVDKDSYLHLLAVWDNAVEFCEELVLEKAAIAGILFGHLIVVAPIETFSSFAESVLNLFKEKLGMNHKETLKIELCICEVGIHKCEYEATKLRITDLMERMQLSVEENHRYLLQAENDYSRVLHFTGESKLAKEKAEKVYHQQVKQDYVSDSFYTLNNIAIYNVKLHNFKESLEQHERVWQHWRVAFGEDHPFSLNSRHQMNYCKLQKAHLYTTEDVEKEGLIAECISGFKEIIKKRKLVLGIKHKETLRSQHWYGAALALGNQKEKATRVLEEVLKYRVEILGENNADTETTRTLITDILNEEEAINLGFEIL